MRKLFKINLIADTSEEQLKEAIKHGLKFEVIGWDSLQVIESQEV